MIDCEVNNIKKLEYTGGKVKFRSLEYSVDFLHVHTQFPGSWSFFTLQFCGWDPTPG